MAVDSKNPAIHEQSADLYACQGVENDEIVCYLNLSRVSRHPIQLRTLKYLNSGFPYCRLLRRREGPISSNLEDGNYACVSVDKAGW